ncbi:GNAT family N-acetyltransferase [Flavobacterium rhizosphaerae]|uniref:GNAT family N-acetyltransferase n=1 Tax=Flavobacterium rhizosphaerae TaxID=3163298 RepID=A0ABW8Z054_9FLAO
MVTLQGENIFLRALEPEDLDFVHALENDTRVWEVSQCQAPYSRYIIKQYIKNSHRDIYEVKQLRLAICLIGSNNAIGLIDIFDFDPANERAGVGIIISENQRNKGIGAETLKLLTNYAFTALGLHQLYANIDTQNAASIALFTTFGFRLAGIKKAWNKRNGSYHDEALYQLIHQH